MLASKDRGEASRARGGNPLVPPDQRHVKRGAPNLTEAIILSFYVILLIFIRFISLIQF